MADSQGKSVQPAKAAPAKAEPDKVEAKPKTEMRGEHGPEVDATPKAKTDKADEVVTRAGGYVDRGDGDGWVIEEDEA